MSMYELRRLIYAVVLIALGIIIWIQRRRKRAELYNDEDDEETLPPTSSGQHGNV